MPEVPSALVLSEEVLWAMVAMPKSESSISCRCPTQHILWLDIAMDELLLVGVLQGLSYLLDEETITGSGTRLPLG